MSCILAAALMRAIHSLRISLFNCLRLINEYLRECITCSLAVRYRRCLLPVSNLDVDTREKLALDVRKILKEKQLSAILVTHNQAEAFAFADKIGIIMEGKLLQWSGAQDLIKNPNSAIVSDYIRRDAVAAYHEMLNSLE